MAGPPVTYAHHPRGNPGARLSTRKTAQAAAAGRLSPKVGEWAQAKLKEAGLPKSKIDQARTLLEAQRREKFYIPDPVDAEKIVLPECLLADCEGLKLDGGDCDDLSAALAAAMESVGIVCCIVGQAFDSGQHYQHILIAAEVDDGVWFYADPSDRRLAFGQARTPSRELWLLVPSGAVMCDHAPECATKMKGVHPDVHDRDTGDAIYIGEGLMGMPPADAQDAPSAVWGVFKGIFTLAILGFAGYGGYVLLTGDTMGASRRNPTGPNKSEQKALIDALAHYMSVQDSAPIGVQQKFYDAYSKKLRALEAKYPDIDFRSEASQESLRQAARKHLAEHVVRGPGSEW